MEGGTQKLGQAKAHVEQAVAVIAVHRKKRNGDPDIRICTGCPFLVHWAPGNYGWIPHNASFGFSDIASANVGVFASLDRF